MTSSTGNGKPGWLFVWSLHCGLGAPGGVATVVRELARTQLASGDFRPILLSGSWERLESTDLPAPLDRCYWRRLNPSYIRGKGPLVTVKTLLKLPATVLWLRKLIRRENVKVVNFHYPGLECFVFALMRRVGLFDGKFILSFHGTDLGNLETSRGIERALWQFILRSVDLIAVVSRDQRERVEAQLKTSGIPVATVYGGAALDSFAADKPPRVLKEIPADCALILSVASFIPIKRPRLVVAAFREIQRKRPDTVLALIGARGEELPPIEASLSEEDRRNVLVVVDLPHEELGWFYKRANTFLLASEAEALGLVLLEAGLYAIPTVATAVGGIPDIVREGISGRLFPRDASPEDIAMTCLELLESPQRAEELGRQLQADVAARFTWDAVMGRYYEGIRGN